MKLVPSRIPAKNSPVKIPFSCLSLGTLPETIAIILGLNSEESNIPDQIKTLHRKPRVRRPNGEEGKLRSSRAESEAAPCSTKPCVTKYADLGKAIDVT